VLYFIRPWADFNDTIQQKEVDYVEASEIMIEERGQEIFETRIEA